MNLIIGLTYVAVIDTPAGTYNRFYKVVREERKKLYANALNYKPYNILDRCQSAKMLNIVFDKSRFSRTETGLFE